MRPKRVVRHETARPSDAEIIYQRLMKCHSLAWIGGGKIQELALSSKLLEVSRGRVIYSTEDRRSHLYIVLSGCVTVRYGESQAIEAVLGASDFFGLASLFGASRYKSFAVATLNSKVAKLPAATFLETVLGIPAEKFIRTLSMTAGRYIRLVENYPIAAKSLKTRIAFALMNLAEKFGVPEARGTLLNLPLTHKFIADLIGASRPRVSMVMRELERSGSLIRVNQRFILNVASLRAILHETPRGAARPKCKAGVTASMRRSIAASGRAAKA
jgi:CRP-like cAMP-binding protein